MGNSVVGARIESRRKEMGLTLDDIAIEIGVAKSTIQRYEKGAIEKLKLPVIEAIARVLHVNPAWIVGKSDDMSEDDSVMRNMPDNSISMPSVARVPRVGSIACGEPILAEQNIEGYDHVPDWVKCDFTLLCKGDSMIGARIHDGDIVCIRKQDSAESGQIVAVCIDGEYESKATLKRFRRQGDMIILQPENSEYEPRIYAGEDANRVHIVGLATHFISGIK